MKALKSSLDGVGTAAGVAWPFFGIVTSSLGFATGGALVIASGSLASILFCTVCITTFYISYKSSLKTEKALKNGLIEKENSLNEHIQHYLQTMDNEYNVKCRLDNKKTNHDDKLNYIQAKSIERLINDPLLKDAIEHLSQQLKINKKTALKRTTAYCLKHAPVSSVSKSLLFKSGLITGFGAFGAIAGCSAGLMGLLSTLGVVSGFAAIPSVGLFIVAVALTTAGVLAIDAAKHSYLHHQTQEKTKQIKSLCKGFKNLRLASLNTINSYYENRLEYFYNKETINPFNPESKQKKCFDKSSQTTENVCSQNLLVI